MEGGLGKVAMAVAAITSLRHGKDKLGRSSAVNQADCFLSVMTA